MKTLTTPSETHAYFEQRSHDVDGELGDIDSLSCGGKQVTSVHEINPSLFSVTYTVYVTMLQYVLQ